MNREIFNILKEKLMILYKDNLKNVILYGSYARNEATKDSDIDILVVLEHMESSFKEVDKITDEIIDLEIENEIVVSCYPTTYDKFQNENSPLMMNIRKEGIIL